eukprot:COSAG02_NODE_2041_length_10027_cov_21.142023_3_plen_103_part_00
MLPCFNVGAVVGVTVVSSSQGTCSPTRTCQVWHLCHDGGTTILHIGQPVFRVRYIRDQLKDGLLAVERPDLVSRLCLRSYVAEVIYLFCIHNLCTKEGSVDA